MVKGVDGYYPIDRHGILLPARDFSDADIENIPSSNVWRVFRWASSANRGATQPSAEPRNLAAILNAKRDGKDVLVE